MASGGVLMSPPVDSMARVYTGMGWPVLPVHGVDGNGNCTCGRPSCSSPGKHPATRRGHRDADREVFGRFVGPNIGIALGAEYEEGICELIYRNALMVIDVDPRNGGAESWKRIVGDNQVNAPTVETGGGGLHVYFACPEGRVLPSIPGHPGIDVKTKGYVVAPPSRHWSGGEYRWVLGPCEPPEAPEWLLRFVMAGSADASGADTRARPGPGGPMPTLALKGTEVGSVMETGPRRPSGRPGPILAAWMEETDPSRWECIRDSARCGKRYITPSGRRAFVPLTSSDARWDGFRARVKERSGARLYLDQFKWLRSGAEDRGLIQTGFRAMIVTTPRGLIAEGDYLGTTHVRSVYRVVEKYVRRAHLGPDWESWSGGSVEAVHWWSDKRPGWHPHVDAVLPGVYVRTTASVQTNLDGESVDASPGVDMVPMPRWIRKECRRGHTTSECVRHGCLTLRAIRRVAAMAWRDEFPDADPELIGEECNVRWRVVYDGMRVDGRAARMTKGEVDRALSHRLRYCIHLPISDATDRRTGEKWVTRCLEASGPKTLAVILDHRRHWRHVRLTGCMAPTGRHRLEAVLGPVHVEPVVGVHPRTGEMCRSVSDAEADRVTTWEAPSDEAMAAMARPPPVDVPRWSRVDRLEDEWDPVTWVPWSAYRSWCAAGRPPVDHDLWDWCADERGGVGV